ncbi:MAG: hypothetical protein NZ750_00590 [Anaerolineae bacterium]|nr:hypothetical protein [Anaerolineae bacterium]MDW8173081.1 hypothetical protein [Anaerolineae bacterium]
MDKLSTRPAQAGDIHTLADYWYDRMALRQQVIGGPTLSSADLQAWRSQALAWLGDEQTSFLVVTSGDEVLGGACVKLEGESAALLAWVLDLHLRLGLSGAGQRLLADVLALLRMHGARNLFLPSPQGLAVEEAFWRAVGARPVAQGWLLLLDGGEVC